MIPIRHLIGAAKLAVKANAPTIMVVTGVASMAAGTITASNRTLYLDSILATHVADLEEIASETHPEYTDKHRRQDQLKIYSRVSVDLTKLYAVPAVLTIGGACLIFGGHHIMLRRNATLALAFTGLKKAFDGYRERVVEQFGQGVDKHLMSGYLYRDTQDENGKKTLEAWRPEKDSEDIYNRVFEQGATDAWKNDLGVNQMFLSQQQRFAQELLNRRGYLWLSEVYQALGFPESDISRVVGWKVRRNPDGSKDFPLVDFGLNTPHPFDDQYNHAKSIYLDFNVQGLIVGGKVQKLLEKA